MKPSKVISTLYMINSVMAELSDVVISAVPSTRVFKVPDEADVTKTHTDLAAIVPLGKHRTPSVAKFTVPSISFAETGVDSENSNTGA